MTLPEKLGRAPIVEATFELRFQPAKESAADLLVGMLYSDPSLPAYRQRVRTLPVANVPRSIRDSDPNLKYLASHQLSGDGRHLMIGDRVLGVSKTHYEGWAELQASVKVLLQAARRTDLIGAIERYSLKALNILPVAAGEALDALNGKFEIAGRKATEQGFHFRTEFVTGRLTTIVELATNAKVTVDGQLKSGLLIALDTIRGSDAAEIWTDTDGCLREAHDELKGLFFSLLTKNIIEALEPSWNSNGSSS
jgi:uncharacterized protein (TIGR04255 family)